jgi:hypothetical protein
VSKFAISQLALPEILTVEDLNYLKCLKIIGLEILPARITNNWTQTDKYTIKKNENLSINKISQNFQ